MKKIIGLVLAALFVIALLVTFQSEMASNLTINKDNNYASIATPPPVRAPKPGF